MDWKAKQCAGTDITYVGETVNVTDVVAVAEKWNQAERHRVTKPLPKPRHGWIVGWRLLPWRWKVDGPNTGSGSLMMVHEHRMVWRVCFWPGQKPVDVATGDWESVEAKDFQPRHTRLGGPAIERDDEIW